MNNLAATITPRATALRKTSGIPIAMLTAYDYPSARLLEEAGIDWILVGDSLGMVVLGYPDTTSVTLADMVHHTSAVARGLSHTPLIADLPIGTYNTEETALNSARELLKAGAHAVKLEGGVSHCAQIAALSAAGIPVMGHIGMLPQSVREEGGYKIKGKTPEQGDALVADALAVEAAGAFSMVVELVQPETARRIQMAVNIPTIGIGAGQYCDGQVLVTHDLVGSFPWFRPKFVTPAASLGEGLRTAAQQWATSLKETKANREH
ncbi:MAG: 3-methyl-2-oxobutanoate hydroxymethyltransferase [Verrucomicrobia bacterium]|nr:MAG: 3-methyl-2-oxobutanoate hydroxymethyltransferase [Verrucomicrobiota bacterium]